VIRNAINHYNTQVAKLTPPRPPLSWKEIVEYSFLGEFDALRHSTRDVHDKPWAQTAHREAMVKYFKLCRAQEEIVWLNVEIRCLLASIHDKTIHHNQTIKLLTQSNPHLAVELWLWWQLQKAVNELHIQCLTSVQKSTMFIGSQGIGTLLASAIEQPTDGCAINTDTLDSKHTRDGLLGMEMEDCDRVAEDNAHDLEKITEFVMTITD
jgi:hypothetical protein